jgi:hypothetical protein
MLPYLTLTVCEGASFTLLFELARYISTRKRKVNIKRMVLNEYPLRSNQ